MSGDIVRVQDALGGVLTPRLRRRLEAAVRAALDAGPPPGASRPAEGESPASSGAEISLTLIGAAAIRELNARFHQVDAPTDVLAFDLGSSADPAVSWIGDVYVCPEIAADQAAEHGETAEDEVVRLAIHGTLHLLGHDHPDGEERYGSEMFGLQERLLAAVRGSPVT